MSDNRSKKGQQDRSKINLEEDYEVTYWSEKFGVTRTSLRAAVAKVGNSAAAVQQELRGNNATHKASIHDHPEQPSG